MLRAAPWILVGLAIAAVSAQAPDPARSSDVRVWLARVGDRIEQYYTRAQSIMCEETVQLQHLGSDLLPDGSHIRQLVYELRVAWEASPDGAKPPEATVLRQLLRVDGRAPSPRDEEACMDPKPVSPEPLALLLPHRRSDFVFTWRGTARESGRPSVTIDYKSARVQPADVVWKDNCVSIDLPGRTRGRVWVDRQTGDVLRLDEELTGQYEFRVPRTQLRGVQLPMTMTVERADSSIRYRTISFHDPEETILLPESIVSVQVIRNAGSPRMRTTQKFSNYRRFMTGGRILTQ
jgi:hypothetical protein